jgi:hypothetical protein
VGSATISIVGCYIVRDSDCVEVEPIAAALDVNIARRLWDVSVAMVKLQESEIHPLLKTAV